MNDQPNLAPNELFARLEAEFRRVGLGPEALIEVSRLVAGSPSPDAPPPPSDSFMGDLGAFQDVLGVLETLPDNAGREAFISAMKRQWE